MSELKAYPEYKDSEIEWIGEIPIHWKIIKLKRVFKVVNGKEIDKEVDFESPQGIEVYGSGGVFKKTDKYIYNGESVLFGRKGTIGKPIYVNQKFWTVDTMYYTKFYKNSHPKWVYYLLSIFPWMLHATNTALPSIVGADIENEVWAVPKYEEQKEIANFLDIKISQTNSLIIDKERLIELLEEKRQAVITETVTKGLDPNVKMIDSGIEWIGQIPKHWEIVKLKRITDIELSNVDKKTVKGEEPVLLCNYVDVYYNNVITPDLNFMKATAKKEQISKFSLKEDDVIITKDSEDPNDIAVPAWVSQTMGDVLCGYHLALIRPKAKVSGKFLLYCLLSTTFEEQFHSLAYGVTRYGILKGDIENSLFNLPPIHEQIEIADYLTKVDNKISSTIYKIKYQISKMKEYRESLIYEAVTGKIDVRNYATEKEEAY